ncbi:isoleucyl-tRNA synthetase [Exidia glandulosa HHB12029]|uniref:isoleucine--tRNA ligase n=1 Tax=Exidia glandulosa HHB12029 TaxID=1314781 RepID=A0A165MQM9_EXIGL|nr:isoleucyl-tRNA synthetase [Exidia glandulosa HHB12029]
MAYKDTLYLPKTKFPLWTTRDNGELPYVAKTTDDLYKWQARDPFVLQDGPPYANGSLHMGHALNKILKDTILRFQVLNGRRVQHVPGWDCHGLPIENKALGELGAKAHELEPHVIRAEARKVALREVTSQRNEMRQFGLMANWSDETTYRTMDHAYEIRQLRAFQEMVKCGLISRHYRPVHWSPSSRTALAEAELEYNDKHKSTAVYVAFNLDLDALTPKLGELVTAHGVPRLLVWTTTPWTLPSNMAIAVHNDLEYALLRRTETQDLYLLLQSKAEPIIGEIEVLATIHGKDLVGTRYRPLFSARPSQPLIHSPHVKADKGTGLVHSAAGHAQDDYLVMQALGMLGARGENILSPVGPDGHFTAEVKQLWSDVDGLEGEFVLGKGTALIVHALQERGHLVKSEKFTHSYPYDWRTKQPTIVTATSQWFANIDDLKERAFAALDKVQFVPAGSETRLRSFIRERSEWCISRQRTWGVPIPALFDSEGNALLTPESLEHIIGVLEKHGTGYWWDAPASEFVPPGLSGEYTKSRDTMDVWFDSGTAWTALGAPAAVVLEGSDQHRGWFQSLLLTSLGAGDKGLGVPYKKVVTHGFVLDAQGRKMAKSLGNVISPLTIVNGGPDLKKDPAYGADCLRLWAASVDFGRDMSIGPKVLANTAEAHRKLRNCARFMLANLNDGAETFDPVPRSQMGLAERYLMHEIYGVQKEAHEAYLSLNFPKVVTSLVNFCNVTLSAFYFNITKDTLYADSADAQPRRAALTVFEHVLRTITAVIAPILPHLAEEIHATWQGPHSDLSVFARGWQPLSDEWDDPEVEQDMDALMELRSLVMGLLENARAEKLLKSSLEAHVDLVAPEMTQGNQSELLNLLEKHFDELDSLFIVSRVNLIDKADYEPPSNGQWSFTKALPMQGDLDLEVYVRPSPDGKCNRCWKFTVESSKEICERCEQSLQNV